MEKSWAFKTPEETRSGIRKVMCNALMQGGAAHFNPHDYLYHDRFNCPEVYESIEDGIKIWERLFRETPPSEVEEVVAVWDETSKILQGCPIYWMNRPYKSLLSDTLEAMDFSGVPYKLMSMNDYLAQDKDYKVTVFLNLFTVSESVKKLIHSRTRRPGHAVIWNYAAGYASPNGFSEKAMSELTGIDYKASHTPKLWFAKDSLGFKEDASQRNKEFLPWIYTEDKNVDVLGTYVNGGEVANAKKTLADGSISAVLGVPVVRREYWPTLMTLSNVHRYAKAEVLIRANDKMLMVYMPKAGEYAITLPRKASQVVDLFGDMRPLHDVSSFVLKAKGQETRLFELK